MPVTLAIATRSLLLTLSAVVIATQPVSAQSTKLSLIDIVQLPRQSEFFAEPLRFDVAFAGGCGVMEGIAAASDGRVFFTEIMRSTACADGGGVPGGRIWVIEPDGKPRIFREPSNMAAGLFIDKQDRMIAAEGADHGARRVSVTNLKTGDYRIAAYMFENRQFNAPNDVTADDNGRIYFSDLRLFGPETIDQRIHAVYRLDPPGHQAKGTWPVTRVLGDNAKMNGIELSPDKKTLYVGLCDAGSNASGEQGKPALDRGGSAGLVAYPVSDSGALGEGKVWLDLEKNGCVDGMTTDADGNLYISVPWSAAGPGVFVFSTAGVLVARLTLPNKDGPVNLGFGKGADANLLYIATVSGGKLYKIRISKAGAR